MMTGRLREVLRTVEHRAALGIVRGEHEPRNAGKAHRADAHRARLERHIECRSNEPLVAELFGAVADRQHLGVRRRIAALDDSVTVFREYRAAHRKQHRADRNFAARSRRFRFGKRECYGFFVLHRADPLTDDSTQQGERISKLIARAGVCSRRDAEKLIAEGHITLDGEKVASQGVRATSDQVIAIDGRPLKQPEPTRLWRYHKPTRLVT